MGMSMIRPWTLNPIWQLVTLPEVGYRCAMPGDRCDGRGGRDAGPVLEESDVDGGAFNDVTVPGAALLERWRPWRPPDSLTSVETYGAAVWNVR
jgi:hypothetical protein